MARPSRSLLGFLLNGSLIACAACSGAPPSGGADYDLTNGTGGAAPPAATSSTAAPVPAHSPSDPSAPAPSAAPTWCTTQKATFCADFDGAALPAGFSTMDGKLLTIGTAKTRPLVFNAPAEGTGAAYWSRLIVPFTTSSSDMTTAFDIAPSKLNAQAGALLAASLEFPNNPAAWYSVRMVFVAGRTRIEENIGGSRNVYHPFFDLPLDKWSRVSLDLVLSGAQKTFKLSVDGMQVGGLEPISPPAQIDLHPRLLVGGVYITTPNDGWNLSYDNVTMTLR
jgi:hypothetical protein